MWQKLWILNFDSFDTDMGETYLFLHEKSFNFKFEIGLFLV